MTFDRLEQFDLKLLLEVRLQIGRRASIIRVDGTSGDRSGLVELGISLVCIPHSTLHSLFM